MPGGARPRSAGPDGEQGVPGHVRGLGARHRRTPLLRDRRRAVEHPGVARASRRGSRAGWTDRGLRGGARLSRNRVSADAAQCATDRAARRLTGARAARHRGRHQAPGARGNVKHGSSDRGKGHGGQRRLFSVPLMSATAGELKAALHDLSVQREELLTKNRQLEEARAALQRSAAYYADLYANAPIPYLTLDLRGVITDLTLTAATFLGRHRERLMGKPLLTLAGGGERQVCLGHMGLCRLEGYAKTELQILSGDSVLPVELESRIVPGDTEDATHCRTVVVDLRGRRKDEAARAGP